MTEIRSAGDMEALVQQWGFLPFFKNEIEGFSIEEHTPPEWWFGDSDGGEGWGPWDWKGPVARTGSCAYGKFFRKKAGFISLEWFADFATGAGTAMILTPDSTTSWPPIRTKSSMTR